MTIASFFADRVTIYRLKQMEDQFGGFENSKEKIGTDIPARIYDTSLTSATRTITEQGKSYNPVKRLMIGADEDIALGDIVETPEDSYVVIRIDNKRTMTQVHHKEALLGKQSV